MKRSFSQSLIDVEIRHHVNLAANNGGVLQTAVVIKKIKGIYPTILTERELEDMVITAASKAGLVVEMGFPGPD